MVCYHVNSSSTLAPILNQSNPVHAPHLHLIPRRSILILFPHLCLGILRGVFPSGVPTKIFYAYFPSPTHATFPALLIRFVQCILKV